MWGDLLLSALFTALSVLMYVEALALPEGLFGTLGPGYFPKIILLCLIIAGGTLTLRLLARAVTSVKEGASPGKADAPSFYKRYRFVAITFVAFFLYLLSMKYLGFLPSTLAFMVITMWLLAPPDKNWRTVRIIASTSISLSLGLYLFFTYGVSVMLPAGTLF